MFVAGVTGVLGVKLTQACAGVTACLCVAVDFSSPSSHHIEKTEAGLKGLYIREITLKI